MDFSYHMLLLVIATSMYYALFSHNKTTYFLFYDGILHYPFSSGRESTFQDKQKENIKKVELELGRK